MPRIYRLTTKSGAKLIIQIESGKSASQGLGVSEAKDKNKFTQLNIAKRLL